MKKTVYLIAAAACLLGMSAAQATNGNNGNGTGGCGNGQQTNGCPGNGGTGGSGGDGGTGTGYGGAGGDAAAQAAAIAAAAAQANAAAGAAAINGPNTNQNSANAAGGSATGGAASSNGTNVGINGQQQGIDRSGNSTNTLGQNTDVRNNLANTSANTNLNGQGQGQTSDNRNSVAGGAQTNGQSSRNSQDASTRSGSNNAIQVDASKAGDVYSSKTTVWAPVIHGAAAAPLAAANLVVVPGICGPRVDPVKVRVVGKRFGIFGGQDDVEQGWDYDTVAATVPFADVDGVRYGHVVTTLAAVLGTSSAGSMSIGGFGKDGNGGQGGAAASGQLQQIVTRVLIRDCVMARAKVETAAAAPVAALPVVDKVGE